MDILRKEEEVDEAAALAARLGLEEGEVEFGTTRTSDEVLEAIEYGIRNNSDVNPDWIKLAFYITKNAEGVDAWIDDLSRMDKAAEELVGLEGKTVTAEVFDEESGWHKLEPLEVSGVTNLFRDTSPMGGREKMSRRLVGKRIQDDFSKWEEPFLPILKEEKLSDVKTGHKKYGRRYGEIGTKIKTNHTTIYEILNSLYAKLTSRRDTTGELLESAIEKPRKQGEHEKKLSDRKSQAEALAKTVASMLDSHAKGVTDKAANKLRDLDETLLVNIQRLFMNGNANLSKEMRAVLVDPESEWDNESKEWSQYVEYDGQKSEDVFNSMMRMNKKKLLTSRKGEQELLGELEEFEGKDMVEDLEVAIDNWWDTYNETGELPDDRQAKTIRQAFFKLVNKIRLDAMEESELEEFEGNVTGELGASPADVEKAEFLYFLLKQLGKASTIQFGVFNKLNDSLKDSQLSFDKNKEFTVESPTGDEEE